MDRTAVAAVTLAMRAGYAARGIVYALVGVLALAAALRDAPAEGLLGSLRLLGDAPMSGPMLLAIAAGLVAYSIWRGLDSLIDLAGHGRGFGWVERGGLFFVALLHLAFAWYAARLALGTATGASDGGNNLARALSGLMGSAAGRGFIALVGLGTVSFGAYSACKGASGMYRRHMRATRLVRRLAPLLGFGLIARGVVLGIMGGFIIWAAWTLDPGVAGGYGETLGRIRAAWHGRALLAVAGAGMIAFSLYCVAEAAWRVIPPRASAPVQARNGEGIDKPREHPTT